jgi:serine/threonine protein kinase
LASDADSVARLVRELQLARQITHTNICRLFDFSRDRWEGRDLVFITMELLTGETLRARLQREGPLDGATALAFARQIADGLTAAHQAGVIHRDFKSGNVMLVPSPGGRERAVIMDFGLARSVAPEGAPQLTMAGIVAGTPAYMAPEQLDGSHLGPETDIYAFGVVLLEMRTGSSRFSQEIRLEHAWKTTIEACLNRAPGLRPSPATSVVDRLSGANRPLSYPGLTKVLLALLILALLGLSFRYLLVKGTPPEGTKIMLADATNSTGDPNLDGLNVELRRGLAQSAYFDVWDDSQRASILAQMGKPAAVALAGETARVAALREGIPYVLFSVVAPLGSGYVVSLQMEEMEARSIFPRRKWNFSGTASSKSALHEALHDGGIWVRKTIGENAADLVARDRLPQDTTTASWKALALYARAEQAKALNSQDEAVTLLREAVGQDPHFAIGYMRLGDILLSMHSRRKACITGKLPPMR